MIAEELFNDLIEVMDRIRLHKQMIRSLRGADSTNFNIKNEIRYLNLILDLDEKETKRIANGVRYE